MRLSLLDSRVAVAIMNFIYPNYIYTLGAQNFVCCRLLFVGHHYKGGTALAQRLLCCAANRKVAGSIPDGVIGIFHSFSFSDHTMALGSTQPLTEMSTRILLGGKKRLVRKADKLTTILGHCHVIWKP